MVTVSWIPEPSPVRILGGGFKYSLFSPLFGEDFQFDYYFSDGLKPPTSIPFVFFGVGCWVAFRPSFFHGSFKDGSIDTEEMHEWSAGLLEFVSIMMRNLANWRKGMSKLD